MCRSAVLFCLAGAIGLLSLGCSAPPAPDVTDLVVSDQFGQARVILHDQLTQDRKDRRYLLDRMKYGIITLADGHPELAQLTFEEIYEVLRTQGINADKTVQSVIINEDIKFWKGEPFEQALAIMYYGAQQASLGNWDNTRAAASNSLFRLRDFSTQKNGKAVKHIDTEAIAAKAMEYEMAVDNGGQPGEDKYDSYEDYLDRGYAVRESNFVLGYLMKAVAARQLGRDDEFRDNLAAARQIDPSIKPLTDELVSGSYNTLLLVSYGLGPGKVASGPDGALAQFKPRFRSDNLKLTALTATTEARDWPVVCDVNAMATDHMWNNMEDVRLAKAVIGKGLMQAGVLTASYGSHNRSDEATYAGLAMMLAGAVMRAGAHADTRYCDLMPQRFYLVPMYIDQPNSAVTLQIAGMPASRIRLTGLSPPKYDSLQFRYVRLISSNSAPSQPPAWAKSGEINYFNDSLSYTYVPDSEMQPYIMGGRSVARPSPRTLAVIQSSGNLTGVTVAELQELYRAEGIVWSVEDQVNNPSAHVLEGGKSLLMPLPGTVGFTRLFGQVHSRYVPQSQQLRRFIGENDLAGESGAVVSR